MEGYGPRVPLGDLGGGQPFSGSITLRVDPETPAGTVTCAYGSIAEGAGAASAFRLPIGLLDIGPVHVTAARTASASDDPNAANDISGVGCTGLSIALANCA
ncbi:hypothetical protein [Streptomyces sp. col6]|uniref:hypothetical protein n=1 Tax=Streptomyces sp. col6 TaxID=2478958 RepID=UPI001CD11ABE|nr:hypothetical protein [Streptomyces sp. col6]